MYIKKKSLTHGGVSETRSYLITDKWQFKKYRLMLCFASHMKLSH